MKASELITILVDIVGQKGDLEVEFYNTDYRDGELQLDMGEAHTRGLPISVTTDDDNRAAITIFVEDLTEERRATAPKMQHGLFDS